MPRMMTSPPCDKDSFDGADDDADDDAKRGAKPRAARRLTSMAQGAYARRPPPTTATTRRLRQQGRKARGDRQGRRGNAGLHEARTRGNRLRKRDGNVTTMALRRRDGKVTATTAMVGAGPRNSDGATATRPQARTMRAPRSQEHWCQGSGPPQTSGPPHHDQDDATAMLILLQRRCNRNGDATTTAMQPQRWQWSERRRSNGVIAMPAT